MITSSGEEMYSSGEETMETWTVEEWIFYDDWRSYGMDVCIKKKEIITESFSYVEANIQTDNKTTSVLEEKSEHTGWKKSMCNIISNDNIHKLLHFSSLTY